MLLLSRGDVARLVYDAARAGGVGVDVDM